MNRLEGQWLAAMAHVIAVLITALRLSLLLLPALLHRAIQRGLRLLLLAGSLLHPATALPQPAPQARQALHATAPCRRRRCLTLRQRPSRIPTRRASRPQARTRWAAAARRTTRYRQPPAQAPPRAL